MHMNDTAVITPTPGLRSRRREDTSTWSAWACDHPDTASDARQWVTEQVVSGDPTVVDQSALIERRRQAVACILIASKDGEATIGRTIEDCCGQAHVYVVSDGSTDATAAEATRAGATVMDLADNLGKPQALREAYFGFKLGERYGAVLVLDDDTRLAPNFVQEAMKQMVPGVAVVCGETRSDWLHDLRWNGLVGSRALAYWRYGLFLKQGQHLINAITVIPGSNSIFRTDVMTELLQRDVRYIVDDTQWLLDIQTEKLGRVVYARDARAYVQDPTTFGAWYDQTLRWLHGSMQGIRGHRIGRVWSWFSLTYSALILDWILYVLVWPVLLGWVFWHSSTNGRLLVALAIYTGGYLLWAVIGAVVLKNWRLTLMVPRLIFMDWAQRVLFIHAFARTWREPTSECKWTSPTRHDTRKETTS